MLRYDRPSTGESAIEFTAEKAGQTTARRLNACSAGHSTGHN
jgi:hypothetical protein